MKAQLRSELFKQRSTRTTRDLLLWMAGLLAFILVLHLVFAPLDEFAGSAKQLRLVGWGTNIGSLFAAVFGAMSVTSEFQHGTIRPTFLANPKRAHVVVAKVVASALAGVAIGLLAQGLAAAFGSAGLAARGITIGLTTGDYVQMLAGGAVAAGLFAAIGVGVGALVRNQVGVVVGLCVWVLFIEGLLVESVPSVAKFSPLASAGALAGAIQGQTATVLLAPVVGALLLVAYAVIAAAGGSRVVDARDVS